MQGIQLYAEICGAVLASMSKMQLLLACAANSLGEGRRQGTGHRIGEMEVSGKLSMQSWIASLPNTSVVVQVGANDHREGGMSGTQDPVPLCIRRGWRALLFEPVPWIFERLRNKYREMGAQVRTRNAAICPQHTGTLCANGPVRSAGLFAVDTSNHTGNWGRNHSDARCIDAHGAWHYLHELASFNVKQLLRTQGPNRSPGTCLKCAAIVGHALPPNCLKNVVWKNVVRLDVPCACFEAELAFASEVQLLFVDTEGFDDEVIYAFPFKLHTPARVVFEPKHLSLPKLGKLQAFLRNHGYECAELLSGRKVKCAETSGTSAWFLTSSPS